jgi:hypothetical protein
MQITCTNGFLVPKFLQILHSEVGQLSTSLSRFSRDQVICLRPILPIVIFIFTAHSLLRTFSYAIRRQGKEIS